MGLNYHYFSFAVESDVSSFLKPDCSPIAICVLVCNDNLKGRNFSESVHYISEEPPFDAVKSCALLKEALESYGVLVIPLTNRSREYLTAVLTNLASRDIPRECEILWFIFSGHGEGNNVSVNGELMAFDQLILQTSRIRIRRMAFFFDCCRLNPKYVQHKNLEKEHMVVYSSPPDVVSYYYDGVGLMVMCLAELLLWFKGSLNELQCILRKNIMSKSLESLVIPPDFTDDWSRKHLPHYTSSMFDINLSEKISEGSKYIMYKVGKKIN